MNQTSRKVAILCLIAASILWSTAGLLIKWVDWNPMAISGIRSGISSMVMIVFWFVLTKKLPKFPDKFALFGAINYAILVMLFVIANKLTTSANAILLQFTAPIWVMIFGALFFNEKFNKKDVITVTVVFGGMILFFVGDIDGGGLLGNILAVISGMAFALMIISLKKVKNHKPIEIVIWGNIIAFFVAIPFYGALTFTSSNVMGVLFLGVFQLGLAYIFFTKGIENVTALEGILIPVIEPILNPVWVLVGTGEKPSQFALIGGAIVIAAVIYHSVIEVKE